MLPVAEEAEAEMFHRPENGVIHARLQIIGRLLAKSNAVLLSSFSVLFHGIFRTTLPFELKLDSRKVDNLKEAEIRSAAETFFGGFALQTGFPPALLLINLSFVGEIPSHRRQSPLYRDSGNLVPRWTRIAILLENRKKTAICLQLLPREATSPTNARQRLHRARLKRPRRLLFYGKVAITTVATRLCFSGQQMRKTRAARFDDFDLPEFHGCCIISPLAMLSHIGRAHTQFSAIQMVLIARPIRSIFSVFL